MAELIGTISDKVKIKVSHCQNPYDLYQAIEALYTNKTSFQATALHMKLDSFKFKSSESISQGISELQNIVSRLKNLGEQVSDHMIEGIVLAALPASFRTFVTVWKGVSENDRTLNNLFTRILAEIEDNKLFHVREDKALLLHGRKGIRPRNNFRKFNRRSPITNRSPSGTGHRQQTHNGYNLNRSSAPTRNSGTNPQNRQGPNDNANSPNGTCHRCKKPGHWIANCKDLDAKKKAEGQNPGKQADTGTKHTAYVVHQRETSKWIADSGASRHMTSKLGWFTQIEAFEEPKNIYLADSKSVQAIGSGKITIDGGTLNDVYYVPDITYTTRKN